MKILALDTSTNACSVALSINGEIQERHVVAPRQHTSLVLPMIEELMHSAGLNAPQLDVVAFGRGPGSFVGVRIAAAVTQGIAFAGNLPVVAISSMAALAQGTSFQHVLVAFDARMNEVYWGSYTRDNGGLVKPTAAEVVCSPSTINSKSYDTLTWHGVGTGWDSYEQQLKSSFPDIEVHNTILYPHAADIALLGAESYRCGAIIEAHEVQPVYIRNKVVSRPV